mgnify:CR=1 FL=1
MKNSGLEASSLVIGKQELVRKPYATPVLTCFGNVRSLTASGSGAQQEQTTEMMMVIQCDASGTKSPCTLP